MGEVSFIGITGRTWAQKFRDTWQAQRAVLRAACGVLHWLRSEQIRCKAGIRQSHGAMCSEIRLHQKWHLLAEQLCLLCIQAEALTKYAFEYLQHEHAAAVEALSYI